jgi:hypothetical protein
MVAPAFPAAKLLPIPLRLKFLVAKLALVHWCFSPIFFSGIRGTLLANRTLCLTSKDCIGGTILSGWVYCYSDSRSAEQDGLYASAERYSHISCD